MMNCFRLAILPFAVQDLGQILQSFCCIVIMAKRLRNSDISIKDIGRQAYQVSNHLTSKISEGCGFRSLFCVGMVHFLII
jgi:hypothetical protein